VSSLSATLGMQLESVSDPALTMEYAPAPPASPPPLITPHPAAPPKQPASPAQGSSANATIGVLQNDGVMAQSSHSTRSATTLVVLLASVAGALVALVACALWRRDALRKLMSQLCAKASPRKRPAGTRTTRPATRAVVEVAVDGESLSTDDAKGLSARSMGRQWDASAGAAGHPAEQGGTRTSAEESISAMDVESTSAADEDRISIASGRASAAGRTSPLRQSSSAERTSDESDLSGSGCVPGAATEEGSQACAPPLRTSTPQRIWDHLSGRLSSQRSSGQRASSTRRRRANAGQAPQSCLPASHDIALESTGAARMSFSVSARSSFGISARMSFGAPRQSTAHAHAQRKLDEWRLEQAEATGPPATKEASAPAASFSPEPEPMPTCAPPTAGGESAAVDQESVAERRCSAETDLRRCSSSCSSADARRCSSGDARRGSVAAYI